MGKQGRAHCGKIVESIDRNPPTQTYTTALLAEQLVANVNVGAYATIGARVY